MHRWSGDSIEFWFIFSVSGTAPALVYTLPLRDALPIYRAARARPACAARGPSSRSPRAWRRPPLHIEAASRSEEHTSELQSRRDVVCRLLLEKKKVNAPRARAYYIILGMHGCQLEFTNM